MAYVTVHVLRHLKEELAWVIDKQVWFISNTMSVIYTAKNLKNKAIESILYALLCDPW